MLCSYMYKAIYRMPTSCSYKPTLGNYMLTLSHRFLTVRTLPPRYLWLVIAAGTGGGEECPGGGDEARYGSHADPTQRRDNPAPQPVPSSK